MSPRGGGEPNGDVAKVIDYYFNTFDNLKDQLSKALLVVLEVAMDGLFLTVRNSLL